MWPSGQESSTLTILTEHTAHTFIKRLYLHLGLGGFFSLSFLRKSCRPGISETPGVKWQQHSCNLQDQAEAAAGTRDVGTVTRPGVDKEQEQLQEQAQQAECTQVSATLSELTEQKAEGKKKKLR